MAFPFALFLPSNIVFSMQIEVETVDRTGTFLGSLWESRTNMAIALVEAGLAKFTSFAGSDRIPDAHLLEQAEKSAKKQKLKVCGAANFLFFYSRDRLSYYSCLPVNYANLHFVADLGELC